MNLLSHRSSKAIALCLLGGSAISAPTAFAIGSKGSKGSKGAKGTKTPSSPKGSKGSSICVPKVCANIDPNLTISCNCSEDDGEANNQAAADAYCVGFLGIDGYCDGGCCNFGF